MRLVMDRVQQGQAFAPANGRGDLVRGLVLTADGWCEEQCNRFTHRPRIGYKTVYR